MVESRMWKKEKVFAQKKGTILQEDTGEWFAIFPEQERRNGHLNFEAGEKGRFLEEKIKDMSGMAGPLLKSFSLACVCWWSAKKAMEPE